MLAAGTPHPAGPMARRLRIGLDAHTVGRRQTGNERYVLELARALARHPEQVDLTAYIDRGAAWPDDYEPAPRLAELRTRAPQLRIPLELPVRARRDRLDLLHVTYVGPPVAGVPLVTTLHDMSFEDRPEFFPVRTRLRMQLLVRLTARRSAGVVCISDFTRQRLLDLYGLPAELVHHVPVGVGRQWTPLEPRSARAELAPLGLGERFVAAVGTAHPRKNLARVIAAVARVREAEPDLELVLCGPLDRRDATIRDAIAAAGGAEWVRIPGYLSDQALRALYSTCSAMVYASLYEGFGLPVLEAMACGALVVASGTTAVKEAAGEAAITVDPGDVDSIAEGLRTALNDESVRTSLRLRAPAHLARFDWDATAEATIGVYRAALERHHRSARSR